jgi:dihydrodipicolinate synthase/N-acetylneuraminate lyase
MAAENQELEIVSNTATPFTSNGELDEVQFRALVDWTAGAGVGIMCNSPGSGSVHSLSLAEFRRVCEITREVAGDRVPTYTMTPELHDVEMMLQYVHAAVAAQIGEVQLFQLMGGHGAKSTRDEQLAYWRRCLSSYEHPTTISVHSMAGFAATPDLLAEIAAEFPHVHTVLSYGNSNSWVMAVRGALPDRVRVGGHFHNPGIVGLAIGMTVVTGAETNVIPRSCRALIDGWTAGDTAKVSQSVSRIELLQDALRPWGAPNARSLYMAQRVLGLPGGSGSLRYPLLVPSDSEFAKLTDALERIGVREWEELPASELRMARN